MTRPLSWINLRVATLDHAVPAPYGLLESMAVDVVDGRIRRLCPMADWRAPADAEVIDAGGRCLTPGLIDCHTHLVWGGDRAQEFEQRLRGVSYAQIAAAGGGIRATVAATRAAAEPTLYAAALPRLRALLAEGVTCVEIKSGYGLDVEHELKQLRVARALGERLPVRVRTTLLAAHAVPPEFAGDPDGYIDRVCAEILPAAAEAGLADAVDLFCERVGFDLAQSRRVLQRARELGLPRKAHVEQLSHMGGARLAAEFGALSADHVEYLEAEDVAALAAAGTVAVLLPGAFLFLNETRKPPVGALREAGVAMAVASDLNPGTSPFASLRLMANLACTQFGLTPEEAFAGITREAARALGLADCGTIRAGLRADFALWDVEHPAQLVYEPLTPRLWQRVLGGVPV
ncbi:imidazolonepropionase [Pseudomonas sp. RIT-PI-AD]|uniref:imidazolonepropionase n=1 Tax=Pseudomonas sp. RIT-PI-AD TaxID=3035294 RepID=UPI0021DAEB3C|nr:imidazolonepropionase [Pseudomonas sp. RIT-PI-AD]